MAKTSPRFKGLIGVGLIVTEQADPCRLAETKAVQLVKRDTDSCKHCRTSCKLAERSRFVWLQPDWFGSCGQGFLEDGKLSPREEYITKTGAIFSEKLDLLAHRTRVIIRKAVQYVFSQQESKYSNRLCLVNGDKCG